MKTNLLILIFTAVLIGSCQPVTAPCVEEKDGSAIVYEFPDSLQAGVQQDLKIKYIIENSCGSFVEFADTTIGNTTEVKVKLLYDGCSCNLQFEEDSSYYPLKQDSVGNYIYKFYLGDSDWDTQNLTVYN